MSKEFLPKYCAPVSVREANAMSALALAFVGDAVQTLFVRTALVSEGVSPLQRAMSECVSAAAQARSARAVSAMLTEEEEDVFKRCRNAKSRNVAKNASVTDYRASTGFEGLIGFLYLTGGHERLAELLAFAYKEIRG